MPKITMRKLAENLVDLLCEYDYFQDVCIYVDGYRIMSGSFKQDKYPNYTSKGNGFFIEENTPVAKYIEYNNPATLTVSFEGPLYNALNGNYYAFENRLNQFFAQYGYYFEYGYSWSFAIYPLD